MIENRTQIRCSPHIPDFNSSFDEYKKYEDVSNSSKLYCAKTPDDMCCWGETTNLKYSTSATTTYSQVQQDLFVIQVLGDKKNGSYLELGSGFPIFCNNTYLLENEYDWRGVSIELDSEKTEIFNKVRKNPAWDIDASKVDYDNLLDQYDSNHIDYLQIDIDSVQASLDVLKSINFNKYSFSVITFEHDMYAYWNNTKILKDTSKEFFTSHGYVLVAENVCHSGNDPFEDWYIHPEYVSEKSWKRFHSINKKSIDLFFEDK